MLRAMKHEDSPDARKVTAFMEAGRLAPVPLVTRIVLRRLRTLLDAGKRVIFDGSPRTLYEAERLLAEVARAGASPLVIFLESSREETIRRVSKRLVCAGCSRAADAAGRSPRACAVCGGRLVRRADDTPETMERRWEQYRFRTLPVIEFLARKGLVERVDGDRPVAEVTRDTLAVAGRRIGRP